MSRCLRYSCRTFMVGLYGLGWWLSCSFRLFSSPTFRGVFRFDIMSKLYLFYMVENSRNIMLNFIQTRVLFFKFKRFLDIFQLYIARLVCLVRIFRVSFLHLFIFCFSLSKYAEFWNESMHGNTHAQGVPRTKPQNIYSFLFFFSTHGTRTRLF